MFQKYIGVDYSDAKTPATGLAGIRVFVASPSDSATAAHFNSGSHAPWSRCELAHWLITQLSGDQAAVVGIDHGFSFPLEYFERYHLPPRLALVLG